MANVQMRQIPDDVLPVLESGTIDDGIFKLPGQLDRPLYLQTNKVLEALGLKWNKKLKGHSCADGDDIAERIEDAIQTRSYEKPNRLEFFESQPPVVARIIALADIKRGMFTLEPEAGNGAIAIPAASIVGVENVSCVEIDITRATNLRRSGLTVVVDDFLSPSLPPATIYDRVLMNPPFRNQADIDHVMRAWEWLKPGGRLVSVMSKSAVFRTTAKARAFQDRLFQFGYHEDLPDESFKVSGTLVKTILTVLDKPEA